MNLLSLASWSGFLVALFTGIDGLRRNRRTLKGLLFFLFAFSVAYWCLGYTFLYPAKTLDAAWFWYRITAPSWCFLPAVVLHFMLVLADRHCLLRKSIPLFYLVGAIALIRVLTGPLIVDDFIVGTYLGTVELHAAGSFWYLFYLFYQISSLLIGATVLFIWRKQSTILRFKKQAELILSSLIFTLVLINALNFLPSLIAVNLPALAPTVLVLVVLAAWYATTRYRMLELSPEIAAEHIMKGMLDGVLLVDLSGQVQQVNEHLQDIISLRKQELVGKPLSTLLPEPLKEGEPGRFFSRVLEEGFLVVESNLRGVPVQLTGFSLFDRAGDLTGMVVIVHDLSTREALKEANKAKSRFLAGMGHDLRTPLNSIIGYAALLFNDPSLPKKKRRIAGSIADNGNYLLNLLNDIIDMARIDSGQMGIQPRRFNLNSMLKEIAIGFRIAADEKGLSFYVRLSTGLPQFPWGDEKWIRRVLHNLLSNAVKYTYRGSVTLSIALEDRYLIATIADTGPGIKGKLKERLFKPYTRGEIQSEKVEGLGLGLYISKTLAEEMGGSLELVDSSTGAVFRLILPMIAEQTLEYPEPATPVQQGRQIADAPDPLEGRQIPPRELLLLLKKAMDRGDIGSFVNLLDKHTDTRYGSFTSYYRDLARNFQVNRIKQELAGLIDAPGK